MGPRTSFALLLGSAMLLTGCGGDEPEPKLAPEPSATPSVVAKEETAEEFIRRWAELEREMQNTGETEEYRAITKGCESCGRLADRVEKIYAGGGFVNTKGGTVDRVEALDATQHLVWMNNAPTTYRDSKDAPEKGYPGNDAKYVVTVKVTADGHILTNMLKQVE
ncbi:hypothetical protein [Nocardioides gilvus]|uniref:hypothetical protein n=1 Tax=Nocardioides gilvus TaxID=1735589 RepID=UPI000D748BCC|nr:hypothetical protein [Nocardioides gilvus]